MSLLQKILDILSTKKVELSDEEKDQLTKLEQEEAELKKAQTGATASSGVQSADTSAEFKALKADMEALTKALAEEKAARDALAKSIEEKAKAEAKSKIDEQIRKMKEAGKLPAQDTEKEKQYRSLLEKDFDGTVKLIDDIPAKSPPAPQKSPPGHTTITGLAPIDRAALIEQAKAAFKQ